MKTLKSIAFVGLVTLLVVACFAAIIGAQEEPKAITLSAEDGKLIQLRRANWQDRQRQVELARQQYEAAVESRAEARLEVGAELEALRTKYKAPADAVFNWESNSFVPAKK